MLVAAVLGGMALAAACALCPDEVASADSDSCSLDGCACCWAALPPETVPEAGEIVTAFASIVTPNPLRRHPAPVFHVPRTRA